MALLRSDDGGQISRNMIEAYVGAMPITRGGIFWYQYGALSNYMVKDLLVFANVELRLDWVATGAHGACLITFKNLSCAQPDKLSGAQHGCHPMAMRAPTKWPGMLDPLEAQYSANVD